MRRLVVLSLVLVFVIILAGCAPGPNSAEKTPDVNGKVAGFLLGLWQGFISPVTFIISIFTKEVRFYEVHNSGFWYNFGFVLGAGLFLRGGILGSRKARKKC